MKTSLNQGIYKKLFSVFILTLIFTGNVYSQQDQTINLMQIIPQSSYMNPAFKPVAKWYIGFPALSSLYVGLGHSGFAYRDLIHRRYDDTLEITMDNVIDKLGKTNYISANIMEELLAFGFKAKKSYFNFSITEKASIRFSYPREFFSLAWDGNGQYIGKTADFSGFGLNAIHYREFAIGFSRDVKMMKKDFVFGGRIKYLNGMANVYTKRSDINIAINNDDFAHTAQTNLLINVTLPESVVDTNKNDSTNNNKNNDFSVPDYLLNSSNTGYALDLGAYFKCNDKFSFGASLLDFGYINWKSGGGSEVRNYSNSVESFTFDGIDINEFFNKNDSVVNEKMNKIMDSISDIFKIKETQKGYTAPLPSKICLSAIYSITPHAKVGLLARNEFFNKKMHSSYTLSFNKWVCNMMSVTASYSIMNRGFLNIGLGLALNLGAWQTYVTTDNLYCLFDPESTRNINAHFGFNYIFGYKEKKESESLYKDNKDNEQDNKKSNKQKRKEKKQKKEQLTPPAHDM